MWRADRIQFKNLFAHVESEYEFNNGSCTVIFGKNNTDKGMENNGSGKTTLFEAISIAITGDTMRGSDVRKDNFINYDADDCEIIFELSNRVLKSTLKIVRRFFRGNKSAQVEVLENEMLNDQLTSVNEANKRILELLGITKEDITRYYLISQDSKYTFFTAGDVEKKEIMNRITSADMITPILEELNKRAIKIGNNITEIDSDISSLDGRIELLEEQLEEALKPDTSSEKAIKEYEELIEVRNEEIAELKDSIEPIKSEIGDLDIALKKLKPIPVMKIQERERKVKTELRDLEKEIIDSEALKRKLSNELNERVTCPACSHEFVVDSEFDLSVVEIEKTIEEVEMLISGLRESRKDRQGELAEIEKKLDEADDVDAEISKLRRQKDRKGNEIFDTEGKIDTKEKQIKTYASEIERLKNKKNDDTLVTSLVTKLEEAKKSIKDKIAEQEPLSQEMEMINFWKFHMGKSGFTTYLANKSVKVIEGTTNNFLKRFKVDLSVMINGFTILKGGEVREKIDVFLSNDGVSYDKFMSKSGGERGRVMLAGIMAIQSLINLSTGGRGLDLLCFDESFHGMDSLGQENIIKILEGLGITTMVITQNVSEGFNNENTLYVVKENGVSRYERYDGK